MREIFVTRPSLPDFNEYTETLKKIWETGILTNCGPLHNELEKALSSHLECENLRLFTNGHTALETALACIGKTGEVITTPFTFASTVNAIERMGMKPVFCDIKEEDFTIDPGKIEKLITDKTVAILPVHVYGNICDHEKLAEIACKHNLSLIYDGAHAFGEKYRGKNVSCLGDITMFSLHATKVFNSAEGGALCFNGENGKKYSDMAAKLRNFGLSEGDCEYAGGNGKMNELSAAMGLCNLKHIEENIENRRKIFEIYASYPGFSGKRRMGVNPSDGVTHNYAYAPVIFENEKKLLDVAGVLEENKIHTRRYFYPLISDMKYYREKYGNSLSRDLAVAENISKRVLCLPISADMTEEEAKEICRTAGKTL